VNDFINKSGLLSIILVLLSGTLTGYAAPLAEREGRIPSHPLHEVIDVCKDLGTPANSNKMVLWQKMCRPTLLTNDPSGLSLPSFHHDLLMGGMFLQAKVKLDESIHCFADSKAGAIGPSNNCISIGAPEGSSLAGSPMIADTGQSLYEFKLPDLEFQGGESTEAVLPYRGSPYQKFSESIITDQDGFTQDAGITPNMQLLELQREEFGKLVFWDYDYQIEVSDTLTRFIPKNLSTRNFDVGDLIAVLLLALLLPDYKKLRQFWGSVLVRKTLKC